MKKLALPFAVLSLGTFTYACSGGGGPSNNQEPCCNAQGETVPPGSGFAGGAPARYAQAIFVNDRPEACPDLDAGAFDFDSIVIANASDAERVNDDGTFELEIYGQVEDSASQGQLFFVRIFDGTGADRVDRGLGAFSKRAVEGEVIPIAPIRFSAGEIGESTLEMVVACAFAVAPALGDQFQNMTFNDVRAFVDGSMTEAFNDTTGPNRIIGLRDRVKDYRHGINGIVAAITTSNDLGTAGDAIEELVRLRDDGELLADRCKLGIEPGLEGCSTTPVDPGRAEAYRFWHMFRNYGSYDIPLGTDIGPDRLAEIFAAWNEDVFIRLLADDVVDAGYEMAAYKQNQMIRLELAHAMLRVAYSCYDDADGDSDGDGLCEGTTVDPTASVVGNGTGSAVTYDPLDGAGGAVETMRAVILDPLSGTAEISAGWSAFTNTVVFNFGLQANPSAYNDTPGAGSFGETVTAAINDSFAARTDFVNPCPQGNADWSNDDLRARLFESNNRCSGAVSGPAVTVDNAVFASYGSTDAANWPFVADVVFWAALNSQ